MANTPKLYRNGAVGFIDWLDGCVIKAVLKVKVHCPAQEHQCNERNNKKPQNVPVYRAFGEPTKSVAEPTGRKSQSLPEPCFGRGVTQIYITPTGDDKEEPAGDQRHRQRNPEIVSEMGKYGMRPFRSS
jgi:hypothetical protein